MADNPPGRTASTFLGMLAAFLEHSPLPAWVSRDVRIIYVNPAGLRILAAASESQVLGLNANGLLALREAGMEGEADLQAAEQTLTRLDGSTVQVEVSAWRIPFEDEHAILTSVVDLTARKQSEEALQERDLHVRLLSDAIPQLAWMADPDGSIIWYNQRWYDYTGTTPAQMLGWGWQSVHDPEELPRVVEKFKAAVKSGSPWEDTFPLRRRDGAMRWHLSRALPLRNARGQVVRWFGTNTDISELRDAERALRFSEERFRAAVQAMGDLIWTNDAEGRMTGEQADWGQFTGQTFDEYQGFGWAKAVHPEDAQPTLAEWNRSVAERRMFVFEHRVRRRDGVYRLFSIRAVPVLAEDGSVREWVGVHTDITDQRNAEEGLRQSEARKTAILESALDCIITIDHESRIVEFNPAAERTFQYKREAVLGLMLPELIIPSRLREAHYQGLS